MKYQNTVTGTFIDRPNRFIAHVRVEGKTETVHVKNTGRCRELLLPGVTVILEDFRNTKEGQKRKTKFDLIAVYKKLEQNNPLYELQEEQGLLINMDSQAPNKVVMEWLLKQKEGNPYHFDLIKPEFTYGESRVDFYMERNDPEEKGQNKKFLLEVKGCTLEREGAGYFPDAPTERGVKHLRELAAASKKGYGCFIAFVIQVPGVKQVFPNIQTHAEFGTAMEEAKASGVQVLFLMCNVTKDSLEIIS